MDAIESPNNGQPNKGGAPKGSQNAKKHGLYWMRKAWSLLQNRAIDGRSPAAIAIRKWRAELIADLGGADAISTQQLAIIDLAGKNKLLLDSIDTWLLSPSRRSSTTASDQSSPLCCSARHWLTAWRSIFPCSAWKDATK